MDAGIASGTRIGRYEIQSKLGAGGMGEVYLAEDTELGRQVALKLLPANLTDNKERLGRFRQEARAASKLNHPNILTIHEIGQEGSLHFIATEFINGLTLRQHAQSTRMKIVEVLDVMIQVACALAAAHEAGIVHRDIKPENIMVRRDGYLKVLDFGLAKLTEPGTVGTEASTLVQTDAGVVMGTAQYLSPEQARGLEVDARTDIFSLGVVTYELIAGRAPFEGTTKGEMVAAILERQPQPLARFAREVPDELERIVTKALAKNREERYQTVKDFLIDLRKLKRQIEFETDRERSGQPFVNSGAATTRINAQGDAGALAESAARPTSSARRIVGQIKQRRTGLLIALASLGIAAAAMAYFVRGGFSPGIKERDSLAVLPFVNGDANPNTEYLSDGVTDSLINKLSQLPNLKVMSRNSVFRFKGRETDAQAAARELHVRAVLTGRVLQRGDDLSVSVELVDAQDNSHLWGAQYNRKLADIFAVQEEIAKGISEKLRLHLSGEEQKLLTKRYTDNTEAYQLYLKCTFFWNKFTPEAERTAIDYCTQAIIKDPNFALPYEALARSYSVMANNGWIRPHDAYPKAKAAVAKAFELDPNNVIVHDAMAANAMFYDWDWAAAEGEFKQAIKIEPGYWHPHELYAYLLTAQGRHEEAIAEAKRAQEIDPLSLIAHASASEVFYRARQYDLAIEQARKALELDPGFSVAHRNIARNFAQQGKYEDAIAEYKQVFSLTGHTSQNLGELGHAYAVSGKRAEALKLLKELEEMSARQYVSPLDFAFIYTGLGDKEQAFAYLEKSYQERTTWLMWLKVDPRFDPLRSDPRFADLLRRMRLAS
jgi:eukaryotic-like serine/threonine-protein kinase